MAINSTICPQLSVSLARNTGTGGGDTLNCGQMVELIAMSVAKALKDNKGGSAGAVVVPQQFAAQGVTAVEYAQLGTYMKTVKVSPPEKWSGDEKGRDVNFFLDEVTAFNEITALPQVFWAEVARTHLHWRSRKS
ncbi:TPA: hypothetical protein ACH3X2_009249 [Trebouxia sp. C0005]